MEKHQPKLNIADIVFITPYYLLADGIGIVLFFFGLDDFFILDAIRFPATQVYLRMSGVNATFDLISNLLEMIPYAGALPISTIGWILTIMADRSAVVSAGIETAGRVVKPLDKKGKVGAGAQTAGRGPTVPTAPKPELAGSN